MPQIHCPNCGLGVAYSDKDTGETGSCRKCGQQVKLGDDFWDKGEPQAATKGKPLDLPPEVLDLPEDVSSEPDSRQEVTGEAVDGALSQSGRSSPIPAPADDSFLSFFRYILNASAMEQLIACLVTGIIAPVALFASHFLMELVKTNGNDWQRETPLLLILSLVFCLAFGLASLASLVVCLVTGVACILSFIRESSSPEQEEN